ncbi:MAG: GH92 family glycosyl hydrolase [Phycisphaerae bacterium]
MRSLMAALLIVTFSAAATAAPVDDVDLTIGVRGAGSCIPGPCVPFGSIHPSPDTLIPGNGGFLKDDPAKPNGGITGFSQLHVQGSGGVKSYGNFLVMPQLTMQTGEAAHASPYTNVHAGAGLYSVDLTRDHIHCEVTPTAHAAIYKFVFPASDHATITLDIARKLDNPGPEGSKPIMMDRGSVTIDPASHLITGGGTYRGNWNPAPYTLYFAAQISRRDATFTTWPAGDSSTATAERAPLGVAAQMTTQANEAAYFKIAVSFTSVAKAKEYLNTEIPGWDFAAVHRAAEESWAKALSAVTIEGASAEENRKFYAALYHTLVQPRDRTGDNPNWKSDAPFWDDYYTLWDSWRTEFPLLAIIRPDVVRDNINAFLDRQAHDGQVATAFTQGKEMKTGQGGDEADCVVADAFVKQVPGIDWEKAYAMLKEHAEHGRTPDYREKGYVAADRQHDYDWRLKPGSSTLAFAYADFCVAQVAKGLGRMDDYARYAARSSNWKNVWDDSATDGGFSGFIRGRKQDGRFNATPPREGYNKDFYEGTCWVYSYFIPGDVAGMTASMGGRDKFIERLQFALNNKLIDFTNEPSFDTLWWFSANGRPDLASEWIDKLKQLYTDAGYPGDEDNGAMSSLYIFTVSGFYPIAGQDIYYLHGPRVPKITFHLAGGRTFTVIGHNAGPGNIYVQSAALNGKPLEHPWIRHGDIANGGTLEFDMGPKPSKWGRD